MRRGLYVLFILCLLAMFSGCRTKGTVDKVARGISSEDKLWNSDYSMLKNSIDVIVYRLNALSEVSPSDKTIAGFKVTDKGTSLSSKQCDVLRFIVMSPLSYKKDGNVIYRKPFAPYFAFEFKNGNDTQYLLVDISSDEWALANKDAVIQQRLTTNRRALVQLGTEIFPNDEYIQSIINNIKENE